MLRTTRTMLLQDVRPSARLWHVRERELNHHKMLRCRTCQWDWLTAKMSGFKGAKGRGT